jgi:hypothetical protein
MLISEQQAAQLWLMATWLAHPPLAHHQRHEG